MLDLKLLTTFREVAVRGSFSDAAAALDFTQPAVSQHISRLESSLGVRVLERSARGVSLTPAGEVLVRHASALLDAARRAEEAVREAGGVGRAQIRVAAFPSAAAGLLPGATRELRNRRPDAELTLSNFPVTGPIISGPQQQPFVCKTVSQGLGLPLADNTQGIGWPLGNGQWSKDCSANRIVEYLYRTTAGATLALPPGELPANVAQTTLLDGRTVPYVIRREKGTINRFIYTIAILAPPPSAPPSD